MGQDIVVAAVPPVPAVLAEAAEAAGRFIAAARAPASLRAYASDWRQFLRWGRDISAITLPATPATVAAFLAWMASWSPPARVATIQRRCASIGYYHRAAGVDDPCADRLVAMTLSGIARTLGAAPVKKTALTAGLLSKVLKKIPDDPSDLTAVRDRALLLVGFAAALRRSELVALDLGDVERHAQGVVITVRRGKTDQTGLGHRLAVPHGRRLKPVAALDAWLAALREAESQQAAKKQKNQIDGKIGAKNQIDGKIGAPAGLASGVESGTNLNPALFRGIHGPTILAGRLCTDQVAAIVKSRCAAAGLDPKLYSAHSLRSGYCTSAAEAGAALASIAGHARHAKLDTTRGYMQVADAFRDHSGRGFL